MLRLNLHVFTKRLPLDSAADPLPFWPLDPGSGMGKKSGSGIRNEQPGSYFLELRNHFLGLNYIKFFDADPGSKKFGSGMEKSRIRNPEKHSGSTTLTLEYYSNPTFETHMYKVAIFMVRAFRDRFFSGNVNFCNSRYREIRIYSMHGLNNLTRAYRTEATCFKHMSLHIHN
jgi:hypothetical protein